MTIILDGTAGISTPPVSVLGSTSGSITFAAPAVAGTNTQTLVAATGTLAPIISGTAQASTSGTSIDFTDIPSWVKRITVMFSGVSTSGTSNLLIQLGDSGGFENTGYVASSTLPVDGTTTEGATYTTGFGIYSRLSTYVYSGTATINLVNSSTKLWVSSHTVARTDAARCAVGGGTKTLSGTLDRIRITTVNGTDTFDAGSINILYEG